MSGQMMHCLRISSPIGSRTCNSLNSSDGSTIPVHLSDQSALEIRVRMG